jgi:hypothetical protein
LELPRSGPKIAQDSLASVFQALSNLAARQLVIHNGSEITSEKFKLFFVFLK